MANSDGAVRETLTANDQLPMKDRKADTTKIDGRLVNWQKDSTVPSKHYDFLGKGTAGPLSLHDG